MVPYTPKLEAEILSALSTVKQRGAYVIVILIDAQSIMNKMPSDARRIISMYNSYGNYSREIREFTLKLDSYGFDAYLGSMSNYYWEVCRKFERAALCLM
ncbi:MAG: hypothetical protein R2827_04800 [Bdellovibrionales bacterium]